MNIATRREFLARFGMGVGGLGLATMLAPWARGEEPVTGPLAPRTPHFPVKAKHVIHIFCSGGPSHVDTWDPKPSLAKYEGKEVPSITGMPFPSPFEFRKSGQSGIEVSDLFPHLAKSVDDLAVLRAVHTDTPEHESATTMMNTGSGRIRKPSLGSWVLYGLGSENQNLPGFIAIGNSGFGGAKSWSSSFLPSVYQGTQIARVNNDVDRVLENIRNPRLTLEQQREQLDVLRAINEHHREHLSGESDLEARIHAFELAFRMQTEATDAFDLSNEPETASSMYGTSEFGRKMLTARRLVERGVRFVQVWHGSWDHHKGIKSSIRQRAEECDQPIAGLLADLKQRGMLDETLVIWGGEFGRTPGCDRTGGSDPGRDHHSDCFSMWMAGGGVKGGIIHGATDEFGSRGISGRVHVHDLHATILALLGFDHERLTYRYNGRDFRLTDVHGNVVREIIA